MARDLPKWMHQKHGAYYIVREGKWHHIGRNLHDALVEYARLTSGPDQAALGKLVADVLDDLRLTVADNTYKNYVNASRRFLEAFAEFAPEQIKPQHVARFLDDNKTTPSMANLLHAFMRNVFKRAVRWGVIEADPSRDIAQFKTEGRDRYITADEYARIREQCPPTLQSLMDIAYITGQRMGDCRHIKYSDISEDGVFVKQQKTKARVLIAMTPDLDAAIKAAKDIHQSVKGLTLFHSRDGSPIKYHTLYKQWCKACEKAGVENAHFHDIRAAAATDADDEGLDSKTLLGHTTDRSHNRYLRSRKTKVAQPNKARKS